VSIDEEEGISGGWRAGSGSFPPLQMQIRIPPIRESPVAIERRAPELDALPFILQKPDFAAQEEVLALCAKPRLIQGPPLLVRVVFLQKLELPSKRRDQRMRHARL
jgi:hypothetical protein